MNMKINFYYTAMKTFFTLLLLLVFNFSQAQMTISGTVTSPDGAPISNVTMILNGADNFYTLTQGDGTYSFDVPVDAYMLQACGDANPLNGISTLDVVMFQRHITGEELLDSPYRILAADVNGDNQLDGADSLAYVELIYGITNSFPIPSWRFVDGNYVFPDAMDPFTPAPPEVFSINGTDAIGIDFIGFKVGDLNNSAVTALAVNSCPSINANISGVVKNDVDEDCNETSADDGLENWTVSLIADGFTLQTTTDSNGAYYFSTVPADYTISLNPPNALWTVCQNDFTLEAEMDGAYEFDFLVQKLIDCPLMEVNIGTPFLRRCFNSFYNIAYCNQGTVPAVDAYVDVTIDSFLTVLSSTIPIAAQNGNVYTFDLGDLDINECGTFKIEVEISCESELGQVFCSEAHIFPDEICIPPSQFWDGSSLELDAKCIGDQARFTVKNTGSNMTQAMPFIIVEDDMIMNINGGNDPILLESLDSINVDLPANGSTWRIEVDQSPGHPFSEMVTAAIEGCGTNPDGNFSMGFVTLFPILSHSGSVDVECAEGIGSYDPNDKNAIPVGVGEEHFIERNVDLDYKIRFQNTGTDTAFTVLIRDTLSTWLDPVSVRPGVASHAYTFELIEGNVLEFRFDNIMLPDSNVNEVASHGYVKFKIAQQVDNPLGTVIENSAAIYFDFNEPVITNTVQHTVGENFLEIISSIIRGPYLDADITVTPNPMNTSAIVTLEEMTVTDGKLIVYDLFGRIVQNYNFDGNQVEILKNQLSSGLYLFEIRDQERLIGSGKLSVKD